MNQLPTGKMLPLRGGVGRSLVVLTVMIAIAGCRSEENKRIEAVPTPKAAAAPSAPSVDQLEAAVAANPLKEAYFGETHVHTSYSLDAYIGGARITPDEAYRFAKGQEVTVNGQKHNIGRPLDFVAVSDHAEFIGEMYSTQVPGAKGGDNPMLNELRNLKSVDEQRAWFVKYVVSNMRGATPPAVLRRARDHAQRLAGRDPQGGPRPLPAGALHDARWVRVDGGAAGREHASQRPLS
jgi:Protein of unknown function (DUF3604)